ncbi:MAG: transporter [Pseudomonadota bacterium]|nr:transporter [Pseudomonadota bacterium]
MTSRPLPPAALFLASLLHLCGSGVCAAGTPSVRADDHAPIGVMADHTHRLGEVMLSYRFMAMEMDGVRDRTDRISNADVFAQGYMVSPTRMRMEMHMLGAMWAPNDRVTLMAMAPWIDNRMRHVTAGGGQFTTRSEGLGDLKLTALLPVRHGPAGEWQINLGIGLPTGSIDAEDGTPASGGANVQLPYPMQLGSGTWDLLLGANWRRLWNDWSAGAQLNAVIRTGENDHDYTLGDRYAGSTWLARRWTPSWSTSLRLAAETWGDIDGADEDLAPMAPMMVPTADPQRRAGSRVDLHVGVNYYRQSAPFRGHRLSLEFGKPVYQHLDGPQLETDWITTAGWQYKY